MLEELTGSLCDAVTGGTGAEATLRELERTNLFVSRSIRSGSLSLPPPVRRVPARTSLRDGTRRSSLSCIGALGAGYRDHGLVGRAVAHAHASGDYDVVDELVATGVVTDVGRWAVRDAA